MNAQEFKDKMAQLPEPITDKLPPYWEYWRHQLWQLGQTEDVSRFSEWPCVYHTMLVNHWPDSIWYEYKELEYDARILAVSKKHGPYDDLPGYTARLSMNLIHQAYHIWQWEQATGQRIKDLSTIVEFGGGYGAMALLCHRLGFTGRYVIYDLPEFSLLQQWYLSQHGVEAEWNPKRKPKDVSLFMALYSLSEVPFSDRPRFELAAKSYLFLYSGLWEGWNNVDYFQRQWAVMRPGYKWQHSELTHLSDPNNWYSIAW